MKNILLTTLAFLPLKFLYGQTFTEQKETPFNAVSNSSIAFADIDGDKDMDVLITGDSISKLYINDAMGNYSEVAETPFIGVSNSSIAFADIDGDKDMDVLITGNSSDLGPVTKLYTNDGKGNYIHVTETPFIGVFASSIAFADIDGDEDMDLLITGDSASSPSHMKFTGISKLYINDGVGGFTEELETLFDPVTSSSIAFADIDGDKDIDLLITGSFISKLYTNDGNGNYAEVLETPFDGVRYSSSAFADIDSDGDMDVLITGNASKSGHNSSPIPISKLYINDGNGFFTELDSEPFDGVFFSSIAFTDMDGDMDLDVMITGRVSFSQTITKSYFNDGINTNFREEFVNNNIQVSPNPVSNELKISNISDINHVIIYNSTGQIIKKFLVKNDEINLDVSTFPSGGYILEFRGKNITRHKFLK
jgi:predicted nucleotidyltransferase